MAWRGILCGALVFAVSAARAAPEAAPFAAGETIRYEVKTAGIKSGEATLTYHGETNRNGNTLTLISFLATGFNFRDTEEIYVDSQTFLPQVVNRDLNIFGSKSTITEEYDQAAGTIRITKHSNGKTTDQVLTKQGPIENIYGFLYRYRLQGRLQPKEEFQMHLPTHDVTIKAVKDVKFKAAGQTYPAILLRSVPSQYSLWVDRSPKRLPLGIEGAFGIGHSVMTMTGYTP